jgi:hypothetical protein
MLNFLKKSKPFDPDQALSKPELRKKVSSYMRYLLKIGTKPDVIRERANSMRDEFELYEDIDIEFMTKPGTTGILVAKTIITGLRLQESKGIMIKSIISILQEELERMEFCEGMRRINKK